MKFSKKADLVVPSATLALSAKTKKMEQDGIDVLSFATGEPDFPTPNVVTKSVKEALDNNRTKYGPSNGDLNLRKAISEKLRRDNDLSYSADEVVVLTGAKLGILNALDLLIDEGDEVIYAAPYWVSYPAHVSLAGGTSKIIKTTEDNNFKISAEILQNSITKNTKVLILNSPSNPTGTVYSRNEIEKIAEVCIENDIFVISDEIYEKLVYENIKHESIASLVGMKERTLVINGFSKAYSMTGWRIGYAAGPKELISKIGTLLGQQTSCVSPFIQDASVTALLEAETEVEEMRKTFQKRRDLFLEELNKIPNIYSFKPNGAFYIWLNVEKSFNDKIRTSSDLADYLLLNNHLAVVPGEAFGAPGFIRLSYAASEEDIKEGARRLEKGLKSLNS